VVRLTKRLLRSAQKMELPEFLDLLRGGTGMCHNTEDHWKPYQRSWKSARRSTKAAEPDSFFSPLP